MPKFVKVPEPITLFDMQRKRKPIWARDDDGNFVPLLDEAGNPRKDEKGKPLYKEEDPVTFHSWLVRFVLRDPRMNTDGKARRAIYKLDLAFENTKPGDYVSVDEAHIDLVKKICDEPPPPVQGLACRQCGAPIRDEHKFGTFGMDDGTLVAQFEPFVSAWNQTFEEIPKLSEVQTAA